MGVKMIGHVSLVTEVRTDRIKNFLVREFVNMCKNQSDDELAEIFEKTQLEV